MTEIMQGRKIIVFVVLLVCCLFGCHQSASIINSVSLGMTKQQVIGVMGDPISTSAMQGKEYMNYLFTENCPVLANGCSSTAYFVRLVGGKVDAYGRHGDFGTTEMPAQKFIIEQK